MQYSIYSKTETDYIVILPNDFDFDGNYIDMYMHSNIAYVPCTSIETLEDLKSILSNKYTEKIKYATKRESSYKHIETYESSEVLKENESIEVNEEICFIDRKVYSFTDIGYRLLTTLKDNTISYDKFKLDKIFSDYNREVDSKS
ncbi:hypothetical protein D3C81_974090 [compost metagenome]